MDEAVALYDEAILILRDMGARVLLGPSLISMAYALRNTRDDNRAARLPRELLEYEHDGGLNTLVPEALAALSGMLLAAKLPLDGARALGAGEKHQGPIERPEQLQQAADRQALIDAFGERVFENEYAAGRAMGRADLNAFAEACLRALLTTEGQQEPTE